MVPSFFGWVYPVLPFKYGVAAVREVIGGFYAHHFLSDLGVLALMAAGSFAVGIGLRPFLVNINRLTAAAIAEGGLFNAEETRDSRRWRTTRSCMPWPTVKITAGKPTISAAVLSACIRVCAWRRLCWVWWCQRLPP